jgi:murein L,D-transpeptidase YafK
MPTVLLIISLCFSGGFLKDPKLIIHKHGRTLELFSKDSLIHTYRIALGTNATDPKQKAGDRCTPEGKYYVCEKNGHSHFYLSLGLSYPNADDAERGLREHVISKSQHDQIVNAIRRHQKPPWNTMLGGEIMIHGGGIGSDWTWGCIALDNSDIKALFDELPVGTPVEIVH